MWSRRFLSAGLASAVLAAAASLVLFWSLLLLRTLPHIPTMRYDSVAVFGIVGLVSYPTCWYLVVYRPRAYSEGRTVLLVVATYALSCLLVAIVLESYSFYLSTLPRRTYLPWFGVRLVLLGALVLAIPYALAATPMAFLHRWLLLRRFASPAS